MDGLILLLGVTFTTCTALHLAESMSGVPYTKLHYDASWGTEVYIVQEKEVLAYTQQEFPGCSNGFDRIIPHLPPEILRRGKVGGAQCFLVRAKPLLDTTIALLRHQADFFLCDSPDCPCCPDRWALLKSQ